MSHILVGPLVGLLVSILALSWVHFRPWWDWQDWSFSTRGWDWRKEWWHNSWHSHFSFRCGLCHAWAPRGCGKKKHRFCGLCPDCANSVEPEGWRDE